MADDVPALTIVRDVPSLRRRVSALRGAGKTIAFVPTMGALHAGHLSLVDRAKALADAVVVSIFVNPTQFGPDEDLASYPRKDAEDWEVLSAAGIDLLFMPDAEVMYPSGFETEVRVPGVSQGLCGAARPGHFDGVATVVTKLLLQVLPDYAVFGEKDYQQLAVIRRLVTDLNVPVDIVGAPTVRDGDGLALSSRNAYLTEDERKIAPALYRTLTTVADDVAKGEGSAACCEAAVAALEAAGFSSVDYVEVRDAETLGSDPGPDRPRRVLAAARLGNARLIDNVPVP
jgi:pantoate--beta-alanine ligase